MSETYERSGALLRHCQPEGGEGLYRLAKTFLAAVPGVSFKSRTTVRGETARDVFWRVRLRGEEDA